MSAHALRERQINTSARPGAGRLPYLNVGCGKRAHPRWFNLDLRPAQPWISEHDVAAEPLPYPDGRFTLVYHSHLLEHLPCNRVGFFLTECWRVLEPGGVVRVVVPDLEQICALYLQTIDDAWLGDAEAQQRRRWLVLELVDQLARTQTGGAMIDHLAQLDPKRRGFVLERLGADAADVSSASRAATSRTDRPTRLRGWLFGSWRERLLRWLLGQEYDLLREARFRATGEVHRWMYDRASLRDALEGAGFHSIQLRGPSDSAIPGWDGFHLDTRADGFIAKPDSLFMEGIKAPG